MTNQHPPGESAAQRWREAVEQVRLARDLGFDLVLLGQHFLATEFQMLQPTVAAARLVAETGAMRIGVTIYLLPEVNLMVRSKLLSTLKPGTRVVSHDYDMGEWPPDLALVLDAPDKPVGRDFKSKVFYWVVPAAVSGKWRGQLAGGSENAVLELSLSQMFQQVDGKLAIDSREAKIDEGRLNGEDIAIRASARDAMPSVQIDPEFKVIPVRALVNQATRAFTETQIDLIARHRRGELSYDEAALAIEHFWAGALRRAVIDGDVEYGSLMAGQSVGLVRRVQPIAEILAELVEQAAVALGREEWPEPAATETAA